MIDVKKIADEADFIVNGYAFTQNGDITRVLNLDNPENASVIDSNGQIIETTMDDIEMEIVKDYYNTDKEFLREKHYA